MGADWVKFRIRPDANLREVRELAALVSQGYPHGRCSVPPSDMAEDISARARWDDARRELEGRLIFPRGELDYWNHTALTDPPGLDVDVVLCGKERIAPPLHDVDACRVYVISHNPVFPIEWRDEAYRIILPDELSHFCGKWRRYIDEVRAGGWRGHLADLYLFDRVADDHQQEQFEDLVRFSKESLTRTNAWCRKEGLIPVRDQIFRLDPVERLNRLRQATPRPVFDPAALTTPFTSEQQERHAAFLELRQTVALQIREWNRLVPQKWKVQYPTKMTFEDFLKLADCTWLKSFFAWCDELLEQEFGLFLYA